MEQAVGHDTEAAAGAAFETTRPAPPLDAIVAMRDRAGRGSFIGADT
jgi:hypothetical protein